MRKDFRRLQRIDEAFAALDAVRTFVIASSMITLPEVFAVISNDCKIGTPEDSNVESVRENLATAILRKMSPMIGSLSKSRSMFFARSASCSRT